ncbi:MAG: PTS transporter subunit EIIC [Traorella sp.]
MNYKELANQILDLMGGKENISNVTHCMTRLRVNPKDKGLIQKEKITKLDGIVGIKELGNQFQIIIGPDVDKVYKEFCQLTGIEEKEQIGQKLDEIPVKKEKLTFKNCVNNVLDAIGGCVAPMLPIITCAGLIKMIVAVLGPSMLNVLPETHDFMRLLTFVGDAGFYFFPVYVAYAGAKKFGSNIPLSLFIACILLHPTLIGIVTEGQPFTVYGIPMILTNYSSSFLPMILITWVMSYVEKGLNKIIPNSLRTLLFPLSLILIMLPISLCVLGPIGSVLGQGIAAVIVALNNFAGPLATALIAAFWPLLIATGMHQALIAIALTYIAANGFDDSILVGAVVSNYPMIAIGLAYLIKAKLPSEKAYAASSFVTLTLGGISEPTIFGILLKIKKSLLYLFAGGLVGGFYAGLMNVAVYFAPAGNVLVCLGFAGANPNSLLHGIIACVIAFAVSFVLAMLFGFDNKKEA